MPSQPFHDEIIKEINRFMARNDTDLASVAVDIRMPEKKFYNMIERSQRWTPDALIRLYRHMKAMRDRQMAKRFLQAVFDDDEISIPGTADVIKDRLYSLMFQTLNALDKKEIDAASARAIATEAERLGATVKKKAQEKSP